MKKRQKERGREPELGDSVLTLSTEQPVARGSLGWLLEPAVPTPSELWEMRHCSPILQMRKWRLTGLK